ncbi:hypothetical protein GE061_015561 [Apolygus lucorum]|uniref:HAT C-terminal dimerisation domain-containing protein n=1 Tax=Apolygus lucorum TaxID=248454 RepID=A0A6A4JD84_APOLU|nr:hypothetical protein GE061_015561 [Apolygus lucorum]
MIERFFLLSKHVAKILASRIEARSSVPDMMMGSQLTILEDLITLLKPLKEATEDVSGDTYVTSSLAIPLANLLPASIRKAKPSTSIGRDVQQSILRGLNDRLQPLEKNKLLAKATLLDPRFKKVHFSSPLVVSQAVLELSAEIREELKRQGGRSPDLVNVAATENENNDSLWTTHDTLVEEAMAAPELPSHGAGAVPNQLKQFFDQALTPRLSDPVKFWIQVKHFTPALSAVALKYLITQASSVPSERAASTVNMVVPDNRSRLTAEHIRQRVLLATVPDKYWF